MFCRGSCKDEGQGFSSKLMSRPFVVTHFELNPWHSSVHKHLKKKKISLVLLLSFMFGPTVLPAKSDIYVMFCLHRYQGLIIHRSLVC